MKIGSRTIDLSTGTVSCEGKSQVLPPRLTALLRYFVDHPDQLIERDDLIEGVWGHLEAASDDSVNVAISNLRRALGDQERPHQLIQTIPRRGYRFRWTPDGTSNEHAVGSIEATSIRSWGFIGLAVMVLGALTIVAFQWWGHPDSLDPQADVPASIAVLPFSDFSPEGDHGWFADGMSEELLNSLARLKGLRVAARTSSFRYRGNEHDIPTIANALGVSHVIEGSVRRDGRQFRITVQLIRGHDGFHVWSTQFDKPITTENVLAFQQQVSDRIASTLALPNASPRPQYQPGLAAYENFLRARELIRSRGTDELLESIELLNLVVANDAEYPEAHAELAAAHLLSADHVGNDREFFIARARGHVKRALALDPNLAQALVSASLLAIADRDIDRAIDYAQRAVQSNPNLVDAHHRLATSLTLSGKPHEALPILESARSLDPLSPILLVTLTHTQLILGRIDGALTNAQKNIEFNPDNALAWSILGQIQFFTGQWVDAHHAFKQSLAINPMDQIASFRMAELYWRIGMPEASLTQLSENDWGMQAAMWFAQGRIDDALALAREHPRHMRTGLNPMDIYLWAKVPGEGLLNADMMIRLYQMDVVDWNDHRPIEPLVDILRVLEGANDARAMSWRKSLSEWIQARGLDNFQQMHQQLMLASWHMLNDDWLAAEGVLSDAVSRGHVYPELRLDPLWDPVRSDPEFIRIIADMDDMAARLRQRIVESDREHMRSP